MCPDGELLSAWYDREVPEPWRSQIDEHIKDCATCSQIVAQMTSVHSHLENDELMMQLSGEMADIDQRVIRSVSVRGRSYRPVWTRSVLVPMPAVAGLVIVFVAGMFGMGTLLSRGSNPANAYSLASKTPSSLEEYVSYIDSGAGQTPITIQLPEEPMVSRYGQPNIVTEAEYAGYRK